MGPNREVYIGRGLSSANVSAASALRLSFVQLEHSNVS